MLDPLTGPEGVCTTSYSADLPNNMGYITKNCQNPEAAFRLMDLMAREDFTITSRWGKEGDNWDYVEDIKNDAKYADVDFSQKFMGYPHIFTSMTVYGIPSRTQTGRTRPLPSVPQKLQQDTLHAA